MHKSFVLFSLLAGTASVAFATDVTYRQDVKPILEKYCYECHGAEAPASADFMLDQEKYKKDKTGPRMTSYGDVLQLIAYTETGALMRRLDDGSGSASKKPGNMFKYLGETDAERGENLKVIKVWLGEGAWNLNRWKARGEVPGISKEQLEKLQLKY